MKCMERNKRTIYFCQFVRAEPVTDENGNETGEEAVVYSPAVATRASVSGAVGQVQLEQFGNLENYDKVVVVDDVACPLKENDVLFIDKQPEFTEDGTPLFDYTVRRRAETLNVVALAVSKVAVS